jgi:hypothetical protein
MKTGQGGIVTILSVEPRSQLPLTYPRHDLGSGTGTIKATDEWEWGSRVVVYRLVSKPEDATAIVILERGCTHRI